jgi:hypothetical protein
VSALVRLPFPVAVAILGVGTAAGVAVSVRTGSYVWLVVAFAAVALFGILYMREYSRLPGPEDEPAPAKPSRKKAEMFADERPNPVETAAPERAEVESGPVEVDSFDPNYDPVAEADSIESESPRPSPPDV